MTGESGATRLDRALAMHAAEALPDRVDTEYRTLVRKLPVLLHTSGLAATCAYLLSRAKRENGENDRHRIMVRAVLTEVLDFLGERPGEPLGMLDTLVAMDDGRYHIAERRAREFTVWLARLASARYEHEGGVGEP